MDVYVVSNVWGHGSATIIGASVDLAGAEEIADRVNAYGDAWGAWADRYDPPLNRKFLERVALLPDGTDHPSLSQEIVCVPLAGYSEIAYTLAPDTRSLMERDRAVAAQFDRAVKLMAGLGGRQLPDKVRAGSGAAWEFLRKGLDQMATYPVEKALPAAAAGVLGLDVVLDPSMAPDEIRIGPILYVVGTPDGRVPEGKMIRIDTSALDRNTA